MLSSQLSCLCCMRWSLGENQHQVAFAIWVAGQRYTATTLSPLLELMPCKDQAMLPLTAASLQHVWALLALGCIKRISSVHSTTQLSRPG